MDIVLDGWLLKSPPAKRFCKAAFYFQKWRKRWFVLRHSGQLPGQFLLEYYTDATCRKLKGRIDLDQCDRVDVGVEFEHRKINHHYIFDIRTPKRIYYLVTETESDMNKWVDCICSVCGLKINVDDEFAVETPVNSTVTSVPAMAPSTNLITTPADSSPYIPISECISGKPMSNGFQRSSAETASLGRRPKHSSATEGRSSLLSNDFYDYPKPSHQSNHDRTSPEPNMDDMQKVPPLNRPLVRNDWENNFTDDDSCPLFPPIVNWTTYPEDKGNKLAKHDPFAYDVPVPIRHSFTASRDLTQRLEKTNLSDSKMEPQLEQKDSSDVNADQSVFPPPRPPKPNNIRDKRKYENVDIPPTTGLTTHYDVPPTSKGVFLSKTLPAQVFSFLKDDEDDLSPSTKVPVMAKDRDIKLDDMYDFPRVRDEESLNLAVPLCGSMGRIQSRKHAYTNAPPGLFVTKDTIMNYEYRPGILPMESVLGEPSPNSCESGDATDSVGGPSPSPLGTYANMPTTPTEREAPPAIDRNLKPKKLESGLMTIVLSPPPPGKVTQTKKSFKKPSLSASGKLNSLPPPIPHQSRMHSDLSFSEDDDRSSSTGSRRNSTNDDPTQHLVPAPHLPKGKRDEIQYLDLDLDSDGTVSSPKSPERSTNSTVYKTVDFIKTKVFNEMRQNVEETYRKSQ